MVSDRDRFRSNILVFTYLPLTQSVRALPQSRRQFVSEQDKVQSMYSLSHWPSHLFPRSSSLKIYSCQKFGDRWKEEARIEPLNTYEQVFGCTMSRKSQHAAVNSANNILKMQSPLENTALMEI